MPHAPYTPPETVWAFRQRFELTQTGLAALLSVEPCAVAAYERVGGPVWLSYALAGIASSVFHASNAEVRTLARAVSGDRAAD